MANLIDLGDYKAYSNINSTTADAKLNTLVGHISALIKTYCNRSFIDYYTSNKVEYFNGGGHDFIYLTEIPIREIVSVEERKTNTLDKKTVEDNLANAENYHLLVSNQPQCSDTTKASEAACHAVTYVGTGLDDLSLTPYKPTTASGEVGRSYRVEVETTGTPDTFKWSRDGGLNWYKTGITITGGVQNLENSLSITFETTTGHTAGDIWDFTANRWTGACSAPSYSTQAECSATGNFWVAQPQYMFDAESDRLVRVGPQGLISQFPAGPDTVKVTYKGGFSSTPEDLKLACYDLITYYYKKESTPRKAISDGGTLASSSTPTDKPSDFPSHIKRILDLYRSA
jgi:hypothetical protein